MIVEICFIVVATCSALIAFAVGVGATFSVRTWYEQKKTLNFVEGFKGIFVPYIERLVTEKRFDTESERARRELELEFYEKTERVRLKLHKEEFPLREIFPREQDDEEESDTREPRTPEQVLEDISNFLVAFKAGVVDYNPSKRRTGEEIKKALETAYADDLRRIGTLNGDPSSEK